MTTHQGLLAITKDTPPEDYEQLTSISGTLYVCKGATATMPQLTSISGTLHVEEGATATMPQLTSISGYLEVYEGATATLPKLTSTGSLYVEEGSTATMPKLTSIYGVNGRLLALHEYPLWLGEDGLYRSGCRGPWTQQEALDYWGQPDRTDDRALAFVAAIEGSQA